jgi:hypothetical protein
MIAEFLINQKSSSIKIGTHILMQNLLSIFVTAEFFINQKSNSIKIDKYKTYLNKHY